MPLSSPKSSKRPNLPEIDMSRKNHFSNTIKLASGWTPIKAFLAASGRPYPFFLDAGSDPEKLGRHSFAGCDPFAVVQGRGREITVAYPRLGKVEKFSAHPFDVLRELLNRHRVDQPGPFPLASGGMVGYLSYDLFPQIEKIERTATDDLKMPDLFFGLYDSVYCFDHKTGDATLALADFSDVGVRPGDFADLLKADPPEEPEIPPPEGRGAKLTPNQSPERFKQAISRAKEHIAAGDVYQVNLSQRFHTPFKGDPLSFYLRMRRVSPAPFGACLFPDGFAVLSNSPERYLLIDGGYIETRPIKGTMPRGRDVEEDTRLARELAESEKDCAEHVMIVDLERNDLGRVCEYDSVRVPEFEVIESYANVHHMVSTVSGKVHPSRDVVDCIRNSFPGGSITGAPKVWAMRIIDSLEPTARGVYCGSIGYLDFSGRVDLNIAIRTAVHHEGELYFQVGGGIVADSDPEKEYQETITKAQSFMKALTGEGRTWEE